MAAAGGDENAEGEVRLVRSCAELFEALDATGGQGNGHRFTGLGIGVGAGVMNRQGAKEGLREEWTAEDGASERAG